MQECFVPQEVCSQLSHEMCVAHVVPSFKCIFFIDRLFLESPLVGKTAESRDGGGPLPSDGLRCNCIDLQPAGRDCWMRLPGLAKGLEMLRRVLVLTVAATGIFMVSGVGHAQSAAPKASAPPADEKSSSATFVPVDGWGRAFPDSTNAQSSAPPSHDILQSRTELSEFELRRGSRKCQSTSPFQR